MQRKEKGQKIHDNLKLGNDSSGGNEWGNYDWRKY